MTAFVELVDDRSRLVRLLDEQRGHLFPWVPVCLALGIGGYFSLRFEPSFTDYALILACSAALLVSLRWVRAEIRPLPLAMLLVACGLVLAGARAWLVTEPVLGFRYYGPIEGRIVAVDRSGSDKVRLTLDQVVLHRMAPERTPARVRVSLHGAMYFVPEPGLRVMLTGHLSPPQGPVEPHGFDFRRMAWFQALGAVGYSRAPALVAAPAMDGAAGLAVHRLRMAISSHVQSALPGRTGAFAAAVTTGDRSAMDRDTIEALRVTNLAHLLAISGLHMGLLTGFVFAALRYAMALVPPLVLRAPTKKIAALLAMVAGGFYYALSGGNVATERAFIMVSVMFVAVLLDRRAITLRAVAIAAILVLMLRPESLVSPGFQMSFAATTALVAVFGALRGWQGPRLPKLLAPIAAVALSSAVAGLATAPVAAAHFNRLADYGLIANLLSVPLMGLIVMPGAVLAALLAPVGLDGIGLMLMKPGIDWILMIADWVAGFEGASTGVVAPPALVLPLIGFGGLSVILWHGRLRWLGVVPVIAALWVWSVAERPPVLIAPSGSLLGVMSESGRVLSKPKGDGFAALSWLENDGDPAAQAEAYQRAGLTETRGAVQVDLGALNVALMRGRGVADRLPERCTTADVIVTSQVLERLIDELGPDCVIYDGIRFRRSGALAIWVEDGDLRIVSARDVVGTRHWARD